MWTFSSNFEAVHPLPPLTDLRWGGIFTPWTEFDWGGTDGGGLNSGGGGFFGDASGSRGSPPSVVTLLDIMNNICFHVYAQKSLFIAENCNGYFLTSSAAAAPYPVTLGVIELVPS